MSNYKLGLCSVSFRDKTPEEILSAMKESELSYIEWGSDVHAPKDDTENLKSIISLQKKYDIKCSSYGTYFYLGKTAIDEIFGYINAAKMLGTDVLRVWCGNRNSEEYTEEEKQTFFKECKQISKIAEQNSVTLCMECHDGTYTNRPEAALELMLTVNSENFRMYWQPDRLKEFNENISYAKMIAPYTEHIHIFNWRGEKKYSLYNGIDDWKSYLNCFSGEHTLLLEFMPDNNIKSLKSEAEALRKILGEK